MAQRGLRTRRVLRDRAGPRLLKRGVQPSRALRYNLRCQAIRIFLKPGTLIAGDATMSIRINDTAPDFTAETTQGTIHFHEWIGNGWAILFSHPKDFTPVCTTELGAMAGIQDEFSKRNTKLLALSVDPVADHVRMPANIAG